MGVWTSSMNGAPWTKSKMSTAVKQLRERALISYVIDVDKLQDLQELDQHVFAERPDLVLSISQADRKVRYSEELLQTLAELQHITALELNLFHSVDLSVLGKLQRLQFLSISAKADRPKLPRKLQAATISLGPWAISGLNADRRCRQPGYLNLADYDS
ncbi:hypothetical protein [Paenibacillus rhizoplanae]|uniref:hypothetical protein n=1 Tax=Paenibacillus rhizoplanae TaxID=1917181 RepID=UPI003623C6C7